jgi:hypothetical protein
LVNCRPYFYEDKTRKRETSESQKNETGVVERRLNVAWSDFGRMTSNSGKADFSLRSK